MPVCNFFLTFTEPLDRLRIPYMVSGSVASMIYGEPRMTNDVDLILDLDSAGVLGMQRAFPLEAFYCPPTEVMLVEANRRSRGHFNIIHHDTGNKADIYMCGKDELQRWGLSNRRRLALNDEQGLWIAPPEYVILRKLEYYQEGRSEKHVHDIQHMLQSAEADIRLALIREWLPKLGVTDVWEEISS